MRSIRSIEVARSVALAAALCALAPGALGCGETVRPEAATAPNVPRAPEPKLQFVEQDAPFIVDWSTDQLARLATALKGHNIGAVVVASRRGVLSLLPDCQVSGIYAPSPIGMYRGTLQVRGADAPAIRGGVRADALQQIATSQNVAQGALLEYRFVVVGRIDVGVSRKSAKLSDLAERSPGACRGATHFIRAALTGAFERASDPGAPGGVQGGAPGQEKMPSQGGEFTTCLMAGSAQNAACSAFLKIELTAIQPLRVEVRLMSVTLDDPAAANITLLFRAKNGYRMATAPYPSASVIPNWVLPAAEISEDAPMTVEVTQQTAGGARLLGSGEITAADVRKAVFDIELRKPSGAGKAGTVRLSAAEPTAAP